MTEVDDILAVTFDCWGTLIEAKDSSAAVAARIAPLVARAGIDSSRAAALIEEARAEHFHAWLSGRHYGSEGIARFCLERLGIHGEDDAREFRRELEDASLLTEFAPLEGANESLATLKTKGIGTAVICDTGLTPGWVTREVLARLGFAESVHAYVFSDDMGMTKPHAAMFATALDELGVEPPKAVHVGDMLRADIDGARRVGMKTIRITAVTPDGGISASPTAGVPIADTTAAGIKEADEVIRSHAELLGALKRLNSTTDVQ